HRQVDPRDRARPQAHDRRGARPRARRRVDDARRHHRMSTGEGDSARAIVAAFFANIGIAVLKFVAYLFTGSSSMLSESIHALAGVVLAGITGNARWDGLGSLAIGVVLVLVAILLVIEMGSLLVGESARPEDVARIEAVVERSPHVRRCIHLRTEHLGPDEIV